MIAKRVNETTLAKALSKLHRHPDAVFYRRAAGNTYMTMFLTPAGIGFKGVRDLTETVPLERPYYRNFSQQDINSTWFEVELEEHPHDIKHESLLVVFECSHFRQAASLGYRNYSVNQALEAEGVNYTEAFAMFAVSGSGRIKQVYSKEEANA